MRRAGGKIQESYRSAQGTTFSILCSPECRSELSPHIQLWIEKTRRLASSQGFVRDDGRVHFVQFRSSLPSDSHSLPRNTNTVVVRITAGESRRSGVGANVHFDGKNLEQHLDLHFQKLET